MNVVVVIGRLARPPQSSELVSGQTQTTYEVLVDRPGERPENVPVVWLGSPPSAALHEVDEVVVVVGRVRRRFFRGGRGTQGRTEVMANTVVKAARKGAADSALQSALALIERGFA